MSAAFYEYFYNIRNYKVESNSAIPNHKVDIEVPLLQNVSYNSTKERTELSHNLRRMAISKRCVTPSEPRTLFIARTTYGVTSLTRKHKTLKIQMLKFEYILI